MLCLRGATHLSEGLTRLAEETVEPTTANGPNQYTGLI